MTGVNQKVGESVAAMESQRTRALVLTDISSPVGGYAEPDDTQSLVRLLLYANDLELEGLVATYSKHGHNAYPEYIRMIVAAYGKVLPQLRQHDAGYPSREALAELVRCGNPQDGPEEVGEGKDTEGSEWIIACGERADERPLWILVWGGTTDLAQALWKVRHTQGEAGYTRFKSRLRIYAIDDQYGMGSRVRDENPDLFYILSHHSCRGMYKEGDAAYVSPAWVDAHVRAFHGPLGAAYPMYDGGDPWGGVKGLKEGDSPSLLYLLPNGLGRPEHPGWGSWGGRFIRTSSGNLYTDAEDPHENGKSARKPVFRWREAYQRDFQARMDWCVRGYRDCNHAPVVRMEPLGELAAKPGERIILDASASCDPDGDELHFQWWVYKEAGTYTGETEIRGDRTSLAEVAVPADSAGSIIHIVLSATDSGEPPLTSYARAVIHVSAE